MLRGNAHAFTPAGGDSKLRMKIIKIELPKDLEKLDRSYVLIMLGRESLMRGRLR